MKVHLPSPSVWPVVLAAGASFVALGLVTNALVFAFGVVQCAVALAGWVRLLLSEEHEA